MRMGIHKKYSLCMEIILFVEKCPEEGVFHWCDIRVVESHPIHIRSEELVGGHCHGQELTTRILGPGVMR